MAYEEILTATSTINSDVNASTTTNTIQSKRITSANASTSTVQLKDGELLVVKTDGRPNLRVGDGTTQIKNLKDIVPPIDASLSSTSTNPVQNKAINTALNGKANSTHTHKASDITSGAFGLTQGGTGSVSGLAEAPRNAIIKKAGNADDYLYYTATKNGAMYASEENGTPVFGTLPLAQGGTGSNTSLKDAPNGAIIRKFSDDTNNQLYYTATASGAFYSTGANVPAKFGTLPITQGGTGATTAEGARTNLGVASSSHTHSYLPLAGGTLTGNLTIQKDNNPWMRLQQGDTSAYVQAFTSGSSVRLAMGFGGTKSLAVDSDGCLLLTGAMYGTTLPSAGKAGRIFFKKV